MGRKRRVDHDLPKRLYRHHGAFRYIFCAKGEQVKLNLGRDRDVAIERANELNEVEYRERIKLYGALREPTSFLRAEIEKRDKYRCIYCGATDDLSIDHFVPFHKGGATHASNLVLACQSCNSEKHARDPIEFILDLFTYRDGILERALAQLNTPRCIPAPAPRFGAKRDSSK